MSTTLPARLLARLEPLTTLGDDALQQLAAKAHTLELAPRQPLRSSDMHRWYLYLLEGELMLIGPEATGTNRDNRPLHLDAASLRATQPLFRAGDTRSRAIASRPCLLLQVEREFVDVLRQQADTTRYDIVDIHVSPAEGRLFRALYQAYEAGHLVVPCMPEVATPLQQLARQPAVTLTQLRDVIEIDPALAGITLRTAREQASQPPKAITHLDEAFARLNGRPGALLLQRLTAHPVFQPATPGLRTRMRHLWESAVSVSLLSRVLAGQTRHVDPAQARLAGLLIHVGATAIIDHVSRHALLHEPAELDAAIADLEVMVGELVLRTWGLGGELAATLDESGAWLRDHSGHCDLCDVVLLARRLHLEITRQDDDLPDTTTLPAYARLCRESDRRNLTDWAREAGEQEIARTLEQLRQPPCR